MGQAMASRFTGLNAGRSRAALVGAATLMIGAVSIALMVAGVADGEVAATLLFLPVFAAGLLGGRGVGYGAAALATVAYVALRRDDLSSAAGASAGVLTLTRAGAYLVAGHVGWLARSLTAGAPAGAGARTSARGPQRSPQAAWAAGRADPVAWQQVWETGEPAQAGAYETAAQPVLAGVASSAPGGQLGLRDEGGGMYSNPTMSDAWPPDPRGEPWADPGGRDPSRGHGSGGQDEAPWSDDGWAGPAAGPGVWAPGDAGGSATDDSWAAVQQSWRRQHGVPLEDDRSAGPGTGDGEPWRDPRHDASNGAWGRANGDSAWAPSAPDDSWEQRGPQAPGDWAPAAPAAPAEPSDAWGPPGPSAPGDWGPAGPAQPSEPWGAPAPQAPGDWASAAPPDPLGVPASDPRAAAPAADPWAQAPAPPAAPGHEGTAWPAPPPDDPWGDSAPTGGTWPDPGAAAGGWPAAPAGPGEGAGGWPAGGDDAGAEWAAPPAPGDDAWASDSGGWPYAPPSGQAGWRSTGETPAAADPRWGAPEAHAGREAWSPAAPPEGGWSPEAPGGSESPWPAEPAPPGPSGWPAGPGGAPEPGGPWGPPPADQWDDRSNGGQGGWGALAGDAWPRTTGPTDAVRDRPPSSDVGGLGGGSGAPRPGPHPPLPAVDPETGLWTAQFLRDRLGSEQARSRRTGHSFSLVLVQVPDGPLAQLPYRRQVTLLRELGYQFVAGGVVDHLVHVPDQAQHWFAVILPDTDRSGAHVLERRLRLGIGGYLSSRGLRLRDLESASLTAPDDDPAMGAIWDALIGSGEGT